MNSRIESKKQIFINILLLALIKVLLSYIYVRIIYPNFSNSGFKYEPDLSRIVISWIVFVPLSIAYARFVNQENLTKQFISLFLIGGLLPCLVIYQYMETPFFGLLCLYYTSMVVAGNINQFRIKGSNNLKMTAISEFVIRNISIALSLVVLYVWARYSKFHIQLDLDSVYDIRFAAREYSIPSILRYMLSIAKGIIPLISIYRLYQKKYFSALYYMFIQYIQFCIDGTKATVFIMVVGIVAFIVVRKLNDFMKYVAPGLAILCIVAILEYRIIGTYYIARIILRRTFFVPAQLNYNFYEFFTENGFDYYRQSILNRIIGRSKYSLTLAQEIGLHYFGRTGYNANNGLFSDAYANLGVIGVLIIPFFIVGFLRIMENCIGDLPKEIKAICLVTGYYTFTGSSFFTSLINHGLIAMCVVLYFLRRQKQEEGKRISTTELNT